MTGSEVTMDGADPRPDGAGQAHADLAFMRALVEEGGRSQIAGGSAMLWGGLLYGLQCLVQCAQLVGLIHLSDGAMLAFVYGVTVVFLVVLGIVLWQDRKTGQRGVGTRAVNSAFGGAGLANLVLLVSFGVVAARERSLTIWLLYPMTLAVVLGSAWYVAFMIRRRPWLLVVSIGWYAAAIGLALLNRHPARYTLVFAAALLGLMAVPGAFMMRAGRAAR
jgi:hypothetical protein